MTDTQPASAKHAIIPNVPPYRGMGYAVLENWMPGVCVVYGRAVPIAAMIELASRWRNGVLSLVLAKRWGAHSVFVESDELAQALEAKFAPIPPPDCGYVTWITSGHCGSSSGFMASWILKKMAGFAEYAHPYDADDFERCLLLQSCVPACRDISAMESASMEWAGLARNWEQLKTLIESGDREAATLEIRAILEAAKND